MSSTRQPDPSIDTAAVAPVGPSLMVRLVLAPMTKLLNPLVATLAGRRHFPMAQIHHVGRRSGKRYVTSVGAHVHEGIVLIPLTFGNRSDWARNVRTAGECSVRINGAAHHAVAPQFLDTTQAAPLIRGAFSPVERLGFKLLGIQQYMQLTAH
jgi:deazaflavin-dependent oxidoreductase (nitroreductase family)